MNMMYTGAFSCAFVWSFTIPNVVFFFLFRYGRLLPID